MDTSLALGPAIQASSTTSQVAAATRVPPKLPNIPTSFKVTTIYVDYSSTTQTSKPSTLSSSSWSGWGTNGTRVPSGTGRRSTETETESWTTITQYPSSTSDISTCQSSDMTTPVTSYSVVYTATITWFGDPNNYTAPFPTMSTPTSCVSPKSPYRLTLSKCLSTGTDTTHMTCFMTATDITPSWAASTAAPEDPDRSTGTSQPTIVLITTDKNPAVVFPSSSQTLPNYGDGPSKQQNGHTTAGPGGKGDFRTPDYNPSPTGQPVNDGGGGGKSSATSPATVQVLPTGVVIDGTTIADRPDMRTQVVTINGNTFTVDPTQVVGDGVTIDRPSMIGGVFAPTPTSTTVGGIAVSVGSSIAVVDGTTFTLGQESTTATIKGQTVVIGPSGVIVATQTISVTAVPAPTEIIIAGGEVITAIGKSVVVIEGTTITYGPDTSKVTVIDDDTITIGPGAVTVHGSTIGGSSLNPTDTQYAIVGGATITEIGVSIVVIDGTTFTAGPGATPTSKVIGGQTITIGPGGVSISTLSLPYPFGPTTTITPGATAVGASATETSSKDAGQSLRPDWMTELLISCIAIGVWAFGF